MFANESTDINAKINLNLMITKILLLNIYSIISIIRRKQDDKKKQFQVG